VEELSNLLARVRALGSLINQLRARVAALEARIAALEQGQAGRWFQ
jgi:prefoldin subunit 5